MKKVNITLIKHQKMNKMGWKKFRRELIEFSPLSIIIFLMILVFVIL